MVDQIGYTGVDLWAKQTVKCVEAGTYSRASYSFRQTEAMVFTVAGLIHFANVLTKTDTIFPSRFFQHFYNLSGFSPYRRAKTF